MKPTNSPTQGQLNPRKNRLKAAFGATFSHSDYFFVGWDWLYMGNRLQETQPDRILRKHPIAGSHSNQDPRCTIKPVYTPIFTHHIRFWLLRTPVILRTKTFRMTWSGSRVAFCFARNTYHTRRFTPAYRNCHRIHVYTSISVTFPAFNALPISTLRHIPLAENIISVWCWYQSPQGDYISVSNSYEVLESVSG